MRAAAYAKEVQAACAHLDRGALEMLCSELGPASWAALLSQARPGCSVAAAALPTRGEFAFQDDTFCRCRWSLGHAAAGCLVTTGLLAPPLA